MDHAVIVEFSVNAAMLMLWLSMLPIIVATLIGLIVSLLQALTQVQEQTLGFAVKLIAVAATLLLSMNWMGSELYNYTLAIFQTIETSAP